MNSTVQREIVEIICPACGQIAEECRSYTNGDKHYIHIKRFHSKPFPHWAIEKSCYVKEASDE